jgi:GxxExxY protein
LNHEGTKTRSLSVPSALGEDVERLAREVVDAADKVHTTLGAGLLESVCEARLRHEVSRRGLHVVPQVGIPVSYEDLQLDLGFRLDLLVEDECIIEVKAVESILPVHRAQVLTYMRLTGKRLGFLINFNVPLIKDGIRRFAL